MGTKKKSRVGLVMCWSLATTSLTALAPSGPMLRNVPKKIKVLQARVVDIYVDASFARQKYSGLGGMAVDMSGKICFSSVKAWTVTHWTA